MLNRLFRKSIIPAVTIGSILEWYEVGLYIYWASVIEKIYFDYTLPIAETINTIIVLSVGLVARPLGGYIFGKFGDKKGRKKAFTLTIILISIPTFLIGWTKSFTQWTLFTTIFLGIMKFLQGIPAGGEIPGAICYLSENTEPTKKWFTCSFALVGPQVGLLLSLTECLLLQEYLPYEDLIHWGWRFSFLACGFLGILGYVLRKKLHESDKYAHLKKEHKVLKHPVQETFKKHKKGLFLGFCVSIFEVVAFCLLTIVPVLFFKEVFNLTDNEHLIISLSTLLVCAILPPVIGRIADKYKKIPLLEISAFGFIALSYPFYWAIANMQLTTTLAIEALLVVLFSIQVALLPSILSDLFPTAIRYTGIGFSFNVCDGILWGLIPILSVMLAQKTQQPASFVVFFPITAIIFLISYHFAKKKTHKIKLT